MKFSVRTGPAAAQRTACLILPAYSAGSLPAATREVDRAAKGLVRRLLREGDFRGEPGETLLLPAVPGIASQRVLLVGLGERDKYDYKACRRATRGALAALGRLPVSDAVSWVGSEPARGTDAYRRARLTVECWHEVGYRFLEHKTRDIKNPAPALRSLGLGATAGEAEIRRGIQHADAIGKAMSLARDLGNQPPNVCTPDWLARRARTIARGRQRLKVQVLDEARMRQLGMGALLAVSAGSRLPARFIIMQYRGAAASQAPVVFVGKGITFDTGGISLKPGPQMDEMKYDMSGAGCVLAVMQAVGELALPLNVVGLVPTCENMPGGGATRPGDIVRTLSGQTVEILNTDAEGRLILCDALAYGTRFKPAAMIDIATLTGACVVALGKHRSGLMGNADKLVAELLAAGEAAGDPAWQLPLDPEYMELLKSPFADVANIGGRDAGTITAAAFLSRFVGEVPWAHLDIAGTAWTTRPEKGSSGRPVPLLVEYLLRQARLS